MLDANRPIASKAPETAGTTARYHVLVRWTHWLMAVCFLFMWASGYWMRNQMPSDSPAQETLYDLHKSVGVTLIALLAIRLCARWLSQVPELPSAIHQSERRLALMGHMGLYVLILFGLVTGWALTDFGGHGVSWFGVAMPQVFPVREQLFGLTLDPLASTIHAWITYGLLALVAVHVLAVVKHWRRDRIDLLPRIALRKNERKP
ncbi:cytochrome b [Tabrizicola sp.]|uniref:cytochrome b n=1 Tax=Tabrizicola sp. TaxID=2005166 RepID=UPI003F40E2EA